MSEAPATSIVSDHRYVAVACLTALPSWLAMSRTQRATLVADQVEPVLAARPEVAVRWIDAEAFTGDCSDLLLAETRDLGQWYLLVEALRDTDLFARPLFRLKRVTVGIEDGFRSYDAAQPQHR